MLSVCIQGGQIDVAIRTYINLQNLYANFCVVMKFFCDYGEELIAFNRL